MQIEYSKKSIKYINSTDKQTKKRLKEAIEKIPLGDIIKFLPEVEPEPDEIVAIQEGRKDRYENGTVPHDAVNWD